MAERGHSFRRSAVGLAAFIRELLRDPSAVAGLVIIAVLLALSVYALAVVPRVAATIEGTSVAVGEVPPPQNALPVWINWFRAVDLPSTIAPDSRSGQSVKEILPAGGAAGHLRLTLTFDHSYQGFPGDGPALICARTVTGLCHAPVEHAWLDRILNPRLKTI